ncbi:MAG: ATP-binding protein [Janthinobacterium lividum]
MERTSSTFLAEGGSLGKLVRELDWTRNVIGPPPDWPLALKTVTSVMLNSQFPMFALWGEEHICLYNDGYAPILGARHPAALGMRYCDIWPEIWSEIHPLIQTAYGGKSTIFHDLPLNVQRNGVAEVAYFTFSYSPIRGDDGQIAGMFCACTETTERMHADEKLRQTATALNELNATLEQRIAERTQELLKTHEMLLQSQKLEAIGKLTGGVAHDFNNVLQVIGGNLQLVQSEVTDSPEVIARLRAAQLGVERGAKLASHLLSFARKQPLSPVVLDTRRLIHELGDMLRHTIGTSCELETVVGAGLWNIFVDRSGFENALLNLAINARDAMDGTGQLTVEASNAYLDDNYARQHREVTAGQYVMIAVSDTGVGMDEKVISQAFEPFFTTKGPGHGTGLGLAMVYGFVKQSGGHIKIYSEMGHGTTVKLYVPRSRSTEHLPAPMASGPVVGGVETILVVEDDAQVRDVVVALLIDLGYRVLKADDAASALVILESGIGVDLVFTDVVMPGAVHVTELARRAKIVQPGISILYTSGYTENAIVHHGRLDVGISLLSKPYTHDELALKIREMLAS